MDPVRKHRTVVAVSPFDLSGGSRLLVSSCEDCACAVAAPIGKHPPEPRVVEHLHPATRFAQAIDTLRVQVDGEHALFFNPRVEAGLVVMNRAGEEVLRAFGEPTYLDDARGIWAGPPDEFEDTFHKLISLGMLNVEGAIAPTNYMESDVLTVWLHVTNECNLRCPYCYVNKSRDAMGGDVGAASIARVFESARSHGFRGVKLKYAGGEASLNSKRIIALQEQAEDLSAKSGLTLQTTLLSNGVALSTEFIRFLKRSGTKVMISLDGVGESHDVQRPFVDGRPSFGRVDKTIRKMIEQGLNPHLSVTISNRNAPGLPDVVRYALDLGLTFSLNLFRDNECAAAFGDLQYEESLMISSFTRSFAEIESNLPAWSVLGAVLDRGQLIRPRERSCGVGQDYVVIDQRGGIAKCHMEIERTIGDVFSSDPVEMVRGDRTILNLTASEKEGCRDCAWKNWCSGGCSIATFRATGRFDIQSPNCGIYKAIYPMALRLEGLRLLKYGGANVG